jgi:hypothetical protein
MKLQFRRRQAETISTFIAYILLVFLLVLWIFYQADRTFDWDILPADAQRIIERFIIPSIGGIVLITVILSVLLNISLTSISIEQIAKEKSGNKEQAKTDLNVSKNMRKSVLYLIFAISLILIGFKLWDKWESNSRVNGLINEYANSRNIKVIDSLLAKINYQDSLQYEFQNINNYYSLNTKSDSILGLSNIEIYNNLENELHRINNNFNEKSNVRSDFDCELLINSNKSWIRISGYGSSIVLDDYSKFVNLNLKDFIKRIFKNMDNIIIKENNGYKVYYRINDSRNFEIVILTKSNPTALLSFQYRIWR